MNRRGGIKSTLVIDGKVVPFTKYPAGVAYGAYDLQHWSQNRTGGLSGVPSPPTTASIGQKKKPKWKDQLISHNKGKTKRTGV